MYLYFNSSGDPPQPEPYDLTAYDRLCFYVKGNALAGHPTRFYIELLDSDDQRARYLVDGVTDTWRYYEVYFGDFVPSSSPLDRSRMQAFVVVFDGDEVDVDQGTVQIDHLCIQGCVE